jgi:hypothetical protein
MLIQSLMPVNHATEVSRIGSLIERQFLVASQDAHKKEES